MKDSGAGPSSDEAAGRRPGGPQHSKHIQEETDLERMKALRAAGMYPGIERAGQW